MTNRFSRPPSPAAERGPVAPVRVYVAGALFTDAEREFNTRLATRLEGAGYRVFLPQRDAPHDHAGSGYAAPIFRADLAGLNGADVLLAVCDGIPVDDGTAWEIGYAFARGLPVVGLRTDSRIVGREEQVNLMIQESVTAMVHSIDEALATLRELVRSGGGAG
jgi:nucleoside 2-deoxyribosyltransferase